MLYAEPAYRLLRSLGEIVFASAGLSSFGGLFGVLLFGFVGQSGAACLGSFAACLEAVDPTLGVDNLLLTSEEWVRLAGDMDLDERILVAILPGDGVVGRDRRLRQKRKARLIIAKYDRAVGLWVNTAFHNRYIVAEGAGGCQSNALIVIKLSYSVEKVVLYQYQIRRIVYVTCLRMYNIVRPSRAE